MKEGKSKISNLEKNSNAASKKNFDSYRAVKIQNDSFYWVKGTQCERPYLWFQK